MSFEFIVDGFSHPKPGMGIDVVLHAIDMTGVVEINTLGKFKTEDTIYKFKIVYLEKNRQVMESLNGNDLSAGVGVKFIAPEAYINVGDPATWVNLFSGKTIKCYGVNV